MIRRLLSRRLGLRGWLNLLVAICVVPPMVLFLVNDLLDYGRERASVEAQTLEQARAFADDVSRLLQAEAAALQTLSLSHSLHTDLPTFGAGPATQFLALRSVPAALRLDAPDGRPVFASPLPAAAIAPATLNEVFALSRPVIGDYGADVLGGQPGFCINVPVSDGQRVRWNLRLVLSAKAIADIITTEALAPGWGMTIQDGSDHVIVHTPSLPPLPGQPITPSLRAQFRGAPDGIVTARRADGTRLRIVWATVPGNTFAAAPWQVTIGIPQSAMLAPLYRNAGTALLAGVATLVAGLLLAGAVARRISDPIARLQALAAAPDTATTKPPPTGLPETDAVAAALHDAAAARHDALIRLQALADTLESRVVQEVAARQAAQDRAAQGERLQALGRLASGIAHDFNNVLQTVNTASEVLLRVNDPTSVQRMARVLGHAARQGGAITGRLLGFTRRGATTRPVALALPALLEELREMLAATLGSRVAVRLSLPEGLPRVLADPAQLETVLINLAANARDAMPQGGEVRIAASAPAASAPDRPRPLPPGRYVVVSVADTGIGMPPEVLARVTEPFFTTKPHGRGTGLGLALARGFAEQAGGALHIDSTEGHGTTVALWLRTAEATEPVEPAPPQKVRGSAEA